VPSISSSMNVLVIKTQKSQESNIPFIPFEYALDIQNAYRVKYDDIGHADILDNSWASFADRIGIRGYDTSKSKNKQFFRDWVFQTNKQDGTGEQRDLIVDDIIAHFSETSIIPHTM